MSEELNNTDSTNITNKEADKKILQMNLIKVYSTIQI